MTARFTNSSVASPLRSRRGSVLIIVMWICLGLVALILYFAGSMSSELRAADNRVTEIEARQAVAGGARYVAYILTNFATNGAVPNAADYKSEALSVGEAQFWLIGRDNSQTPTTEPVFGLVDEASKLNLNTATRAMLLELPNMTPELADAIVSWRRAANAQTADASGGSADNVYARLDPPRANKGGLFESVDELRLVDGATLEVLFGEDTNRNGALDPNEDDGEQSAPRDNQDGQLQPGLLEYVTVYSRQPNTKADGSRRVNIATTQGRQGLRQLLLSKGIEPQRVATIVNNSNGNTGGGGGQGGRGGPGGQQPPQPDLTSIAEFMLLSRMTADEFVLIHSDITATTGNSTAGLVNVNTASAAVLACIPGIGLDNAATLVAYRVAHPDVLTSMAWLPQVLSNAGIRRAGPFITDQSYQFTADIAAVGHFGRGYSREKIIFDMRNGIPRIIYHQDLSSYGWALGARVRQTVKGNNPS